MEDEGPQNAVNFAADPKIVIELSQIDCNFDPNNQIPKNDALGNDANPAEVQRLSRIRSLRPTSRRIKHIKELKTVNKNKTRKITPHQKLFDKDNSPSLINHSVKQIDRLDLIEEHKMEVLSSV